MKINGVEIEVFKADITKIKVDVIVVEAAQKSVVKTAKILEVNRKEADAKHVIRVVLDRGAGGVHEGEIRDACANALKSAGSLGVESIAFAALGCRGNGFPRLAGAKIMAQEVFRYVREAKHTLKNIKFVLASKEEYEFFKRAIYSYLTHMVEKLSQGPFVTVDIIIEIGAGIVLIKRSNPPFGWAIPGGFVDYGESLEEAAAREAKEETSLVVKNLKQMHTYSDPLRDPRFHTVSTVFVAQAKGKPRAGSDAAQAQVFKPDEWPDVNLAFDHRKVLDDYLRNREIFKKKY